MPARSHWKPAGVVFLVASSLLWLLVGDRLRMNIDEGIYLDGALRVTQGQAPYRDFFLVNGPASPWIYAGAFKLLGVSLAHARLPLICELAIVTTVVFFLTSSLTTSGIGAMTALLFFALQNYRLEAIAVNHRSDSGALAFVAVAVAYQSIRRVSRPLAFAAGALAAASAWFTPTLGLALAAIALWLLSQAGIRKLAPTFLLGVAATSLICVCALIAQRAMLPFLETFLWAGGNYSKANTVPYGWAGTGYGDIGAGLGVVGWGVYSIVLIAIAAPAILPIATWLFWSLYFVIRRIPLRRETGILFLLICSLTLLLSTYPRWDIDHLRHVAPIFYVLAATLLYRTLPSKSIAPVFAGAIFIAITIWAPMIAGHESYEKLQTASGPMRIQTEDSTLIRTLMSRIRPGDSLLVFPYFPTIYFVTGGVNPTRFSWIQPGMMGKAQEADILKDLQSRPPQWIVYENLRPEDYLKHWPSSDPSRLRMESIEQFIKANYRFVVGQKHRLGEFLLLQRSTS